MRSVPLILNHNVPQVSALGPIVFNLYTTPHADILRELGIEFYVYADDLLLYFTFQPIDQDSADVVVNKTQRCMVEWMVHNKLKLNDDKTKFIVIGTREQRNKIDILHININRIYIAPTLLFVT